MTVPETEPSGKQRVTNALASLGGWIAAAFLVGFAFVLLTGARRAHRQAVAESRQYDSLHREVERMKVENESLRAEIRALQQDPVYIESVLRSRKMAEPRETILGR